MLLVGKFFEIMITREREREKGGRGREREKERAGYNITEVN